MFSDEWALTQDKNLVQFSTGISLSMSNTVHYIQHALLLVLEDIIASSIKAVPLKVHRPFGSLKNFAWILTCSLVSVWFVFVSFNF